MIPLEDALRQLPRREGKPDWNDLESRLSRLKPTRRARRVGLRRRLALGLAGFCLLAAGSYLAWTWTEPASAVAWESAHEQAAAADPWADPWVAAALETSR